MPALGGNGLAFYLTDAFFDVGRIGIAMPGSGHSADSDSYAGNTGDVDATDGTDRIAEAIEHVSLTPAAAQWAILGATAATFTFPDFNSFFGLHGIPAPEEASREPGATPVLGNAIDVGGAIPFGGVIDLPDLGNNLWLNTDALRGDGSFFGALHGTFGEDWPAFNLEALPSGDPGGVTALPAEDDSFDGTIPVESPAAPISAVLLPDPLVDENAAGAIVGTLSAVDGVGPVTYSISSDPSGYFEIRGDALALKADVSLDHEASDSYSVSVVGTDADNNTASSDFTVVVGDVDEAPAGIADDGALVIVEDAGTGVETSPAGVSPDDGGTAPLSLVDEALGFKITFLDDLIINVADGISEDALAAALEAVGGSILEGAGQGVQLWSVSGDADAAAATLADLGVADAIERNAHIEDTISEVIEQAIISASPLPVTPQSPGFGATAVTPDDLHYNQLYGLDMISAPDAWERETGSSSVIVGVIDSGIDIDHPDLINNLWVNTGEIWGDGIDNDGNGYVDDYNGYDFVRNAGIGPGYAYDDERGHGTHVAGTIAAEGDNGIGVVGVAWDAQLMAAKFLDASGNGYTFNAVRAVQYTTDNGAHVSNNSWTGGSYSGSLNNAINNARLAGNLFVAAAGNEGHDSDVTPNYPAGYTQDNVISVASTTATDARSSFSNYGAISVDLAAPGSSIYSTTVGGGYGYKNGTSMAAPHVTGAIALMLSADPTLTYTEIRDALFNSVDPVSSMNGITTTGGRLNVDAALAAVMPDVAISDVVLPDSLVDENAAGAVVGTLSAVDGVGAVTYSISSDPSGHFEIRGDDLALKAGVSLDHETLDSYSVTVVGTDADSNTASSVFIVTVGDVNEAPVGIAGNGAPGIAEDAGIGTVIETYSVNHPDDGDTATYSLVDDAGGLFAIDAATGAVTVAGTLDYEISTSHSVTIRATDGGGLSVDRVVSVSVTDGNDAPVAVADSYTATENGSLTIAAGAGVLLNDTDVDVSDTLSVTAYDAVSMNGATVVLAADGGFTYTPAADFFGADSFSYTVSDGNGGTDSATVSITVDPASLFSAGEDVIDFNSVVAGSYAAGSQYDGLGGNDTVILAGSAPAATTAGFDSLQAFEAGAGDDFVTGGALNDIVNAGFGNDTVSGGAGADTLDGGGRP